MSWRPVLVGRGRIKRGGMQINREKMCKRYTM